MSTEKARTAPRITPSYHHLALHPTHKHVKNHTPQQVINQIDLLSCPAVLAKRSGLSRPTLSHLAMGQSEHSSLMKSRCVIVLCGMCRDWQIPLHRPRICEHEVQHNLRAFGYFNPPSASRGRYVSKLSSAVIHRSMTAPI